MRLGKQYYLWLTTLSLLALLGVQGYFVVSYFHRDQEQLTEEVQAVVVDAIAEQEQAQRLDLVSRFEIYLIEGNEVDISLYPHWSGTGYTYALRDADGSEQDLPVILYDLPAITDTVGWNQNPEKVASAYAQHLLPQLATGQMYLWTPQIEEEFFWWYHLITLDSAGFQQRLTDKLAALRIYDGFTVLYGDSVQHFQDTLGGTTLATVPSFARVTGVPQYLQVVIANPFLTLLWRSLGVLAISFGIVLMATFTFVRLFRGLMREKRLGELKDDFINNVTHELQTPLATTRVALEAAQRHNRKHEVPTATRDYLGIAQQEVNHLSGMIDHLLKVRTLGREHAFQPEACEAATLLQRCANAAELASTKPLTIAWTEDSAEVLVLADPLHLTQVFANLLDNAIKYGAEDGVTVTLQVRMQENQGLMTIRDDGPGISAQHCGRIFDRFYRGAQDENRTIRGLGLGLFYVKTALEQMGGSISVASQLAEGTTFSITLPIATDEDTLGRR